MFLLFDQENNKSMMFLSHEDQMDGPLSLSMARTASLSYFLLSVAAYLLFTLFHYYLNIKIKYVTIYIHTF